MVVNFFVLRVVKIAKIIDLRYAYDNFAQIVEKNHIQSSCYKILSGNGSRMYLDVFDQKQQVESLQKEYILYLDAVKKNGEQSFEAAHQLSYMGMAFYNALHLGMNDEYSKHIKLLIGWNNKVDKIISAYMSSDEFNLLELEAMYGEVSCEVERYLRVCNITLMSIRSQPNIQKVKKLINLSLDLVEGFWGKNTPQVAELCYYISLSYFLNDFYLNDPLRRDKFKDAVFYAKKCYDIYKFDFGDNSLIANNVLEYLSNVYMFQEDFERAIDGYNKLILNYRQNNVDKSQIDDLNLRIIKALFLNDLFDECIDFCENCIRHNFSEKFKNDGLGALYYYLGVSYRELYQFDKSKKYLILAVQFLEICVQKSDNYIYSQLLDSAEEYLGY
ncbi:hypothetical protein JCM14713_29050 [Desulfomicrobium salsuginis]